MHLLPRSFPWLVTAALLLAGAWGQAAPAAEPVFIPDDVWQRVVARGSDGFPGRDPRPWSPGASIRLQGIITLNVEAMGVPAGRVDAAAVAVARAATAAGALGWPAPAAAWFETVQRIRAADAQAFLDGHPDWRHGFRLSIDQGKALLVLGKDPWERLDTDTVTATAAPAAFKEALRGTLRECMAMEQGRLWAAAQRGLLLKGFGPGSSGAEELLPVLSGPVKRWLAIEAVLLDRHLQAFTDILRPPAPAGPATAGAAAKVAPTRPMKPGTRRLTPEQKALMEAWMLHLTAVRNAFPKLQGYRKADIQVLERMAQDELFADDRREQYQTIAAMYLRVIDMPQDEKDQARERYDRLAAVETARSGKFWFGELTSYFTHRERRDYYRIMLRLRDRPDPALLTDRWTGAKMHWSGSVERGSYAWPNGGTVDDVVWTLSAAELANQIAAPSFTAELQRTMRLVCAGARSADRPDAAKLDELRAWIREFPGEEGGANAQLSLMHWRNGAWESDPR